MTGFLTPRFRFGTMVLASVALMAAVAGCGVSPSASTSDTLATPNEQRTVIDLLGSGASAGVGPYTVGADMIFSTASSKMRPVQALELTNTSGKSIVLKSVNSSSPAFIVQSLVQNVTLKAGKTQIVNVAFEPRTVGVSNGTIEVDTNSATSVAISVSGLNAAGIEGNGEPSLQQIFNGLGYVTNVAMPATPPTNTGFNPDNIANSISTSKGAVGDEILVKGFRRADPSQPVQLIPLAVYMNRSTDTLGWFGINEAGSATNTQNAVAFTGGSDELGGDNQQLLPGVGDGSYSALAPGSTVSFVPKWSDFGFCDIQHHVFSDDSLNYGGRHQVRIYPAKGPDGTVVPSSYLIAEDSIDANKMENYDYQDEVFLLENASAIVP